MSRNSPSRSAYDTPGANIDFNPDLCFVLPTPLEAFPNGNGGSSQENSSSSNDRNRAYIMELKNQIRQMQSQLIQLTNVVTEQQSQSILLKKEITEMRQLLMQLLLQRTSPSTSETNTGRTGSNTSANASNSALNNDNRQHRNNQNIAVRIDFHGTNRESLSSQLVESQPTTSPAKRFKNNEGLNKAGESQMTLNIRSNHEITFPKSTGPYYRMSLADILEDPNYRKTDRNLVLNENFHGLLETIIRKYFNNITGTMHMALISSSGKESSQEAFYPSLYQLGTCKDNYSFVWSHKLTIGHDNNELKDLRMQLLHQNTWGKIVGNKRTTTMEYIPSFPSGRLVRADCTCRDGAEKHNLYKPDLFIWLSPDSTDSNGMIDELTNPVRTVIHFDGNGECQILLSVQMPQGLSLTVDNRSLHLKMSLVMNGNISFYQLTEDGLKGKFLFKRIDRLNYNTEFTVCRPKLEEVNDELFAVSSYEETFNGKNHTVTCYVSGDNVRPRLTKLGADRFSIPLEFVYLDDGDLSSVLNSQGTEFHRLEYIEGHQPNTTSQATTVDPNRQSRDIDRSSDILPNVVPSSSTQDYVLQ